MQNRVLGWSLTAFLSVWAGVASAANPLKTALFVDKKTNTLQVVEMREGLPKVVKKFHVTLGQVKGDKEEEGDLKTPEGIYTFKSRLTPPGLKPKFGDLAFYVNYPNTFDQMAGRTGFDIMLHATNTPERLSQNYDSEGCIVVKNEEIREIQSYIRLGLTPILIYPELSEDFLSPAGDVPLRKFFDSWVQAWESESIDRYIEHYHTDFSANGKNKSQWKAYKTALNGRYSSIFVGPEDVMIYRHPKYSVITFTQNYQSKIRGGGWGHRSRGTKILYVAEEAGQPKIIAETFTNLMW